MRLSALSRHSWPNEKFRSYMVGFLVAEMGLEVDMGAVLAEMTQHVGVEVEEKAMAGV